MADLTRICFNDDCSDVKTNDLTLASMFTIDTQPYTIAQGMEITQADVEAALNFAGMGNIGASGLKFVAPAVTNIGPYEWSDLDASHHEYAYPEVTITFSDGSTLTKQVPFMRTMVSGRVYAAKTSSSSGIIDTGLTLDYSYRYVTEGCVQPGVMGVIVGAFESTSLRTTLRLLGSANKAQHCFPSLSEISQSTSNIDITKMFTADYGRTGINMTQGSVTYSRSITTGGTGTGTAPIYLFNESVGANYNFAILREVQIYDANDTLLRLFHPYNLKGEIVILDTANLTTEQLQDILTNGDDSQYASRIYRPTVGTLIEVDESEVQ